MSQNPFTLLGAREIRASRALQHVSHSAGQTPPKSQSAPPRGSSSDNTNGGPPARPPSTPWARGTPRTQSGPRVGDRNAVRLLHRLAHHFESPGCLWGAPAPGTILAGALSRRGHALRGPLRRLGQLQSGRHDRVSFQILEQRASNTLRPLAPETSAPLVVVGDILAAGTL